MEYPSYQALCATPEAQADFLEELGDRISAAADKWEVKKIMESTLVAGKPISVGKYLATLELASGDWNREPEDEPALRRFVSMAKRIEEIHPDINPSGFVFQWESMPRVDAAPRKTARVESVAVAITAPSLGQNVSNGARVVPAKPAAEANSVTFDSRPKMRMG